jgi:uncharacterized SAM-binding protein YcdF (DUF218 family)
LASGRESDRVDDRTLDPDIRGLVETIWHYHQLNHPLSASDAILVLCSHDTAVAERAVDVFLQGYAPLVIFSGGLGGITKRLWTEPEADQFAAIAAARGIPRDRILIENRSTNTGENVAFTRTLLAERGIDPRRFILVQKPYMERRSFATFRKVWPEKDVIVTSPRVSLDDYLSTYTHAALSPKDVVGIMVGDLQRVKLYPEMGFQIAQEIPSEVWAAFEALVAAGYDTHLIRSTQIRPDPSARVP